MLRNIPGLSRLLRGLIFLVMDANMKSFYVKRGKALREKLMNISKRHVKKLAPAKYHDMLIPEWEIGSKRRIFDEDYLKALNYDHCDLIPEKPLKVTENSVIKQDGTKIPADAIIYGEFL